MSEPPLLLCVCPRTALFYLQGKGKDEKDAEKPGLSKKPRPASQYFDLQDFVHDEAGNQFRIEICGFLGHLSARRRHIPDLGNAGGV